MYAIRRSAEALMLVALAACAGSNANANAKPVEPLVIPPMGKVDPSTLPPPPPRAQELHVPTEEECTQIMTRIIEVSLDQAGLKDPKQREELIKQFTGRTSETAKTCEKLMVNDEAMHCVSTATDIGSIHACMKKSDAPTDDDDDR